MRISIVNGRLIDPSQNFDSVQDLHIAEGRVLARGAAPLSFYADRVIDARGLIVCPGLVDLEAHLREPGAEHKATISSESRAAVAGGITTLCCPPDTDPVIDTPAVAALIQGRAEQCGMTRVFPLGALTQGLKGEHITEMAALKAAGCVGVSNALCPVPNTQVMRRAMEYAATYDLTVFLHTEDPWLSDNGCVHEGAVSTRLGLPGIPEAAETVAVARALALAEHTGTRLHFCQLSTARAVQLIARAQYDGLPVTASVSSHHLHLTEIDIGEFNSACHVRPPLRTERDRDALRGGVARGVISAICSAHQPHEADAKLAPFSETAPGISALETLLPLSLRLADDGAMSVSEVIARLTCQPAKIAGISAGTLAAGTRADVCIFDPARYWEVKPERMLSRGHNTPFVHWEVKGQVRYTLSGGEVVYEQCDA